MIIFSNSTEGFLQRNWRIGVPFLLFIFGFLGWQLGLFNYVPEIKTPFGDFGLKNKAVIKEAFVKEAIVDSSSILPSSIYSILYDIYNTEGTSRERKNSFEKYKNFQTPKDTKGKIVDIGTDGNTVVIEGLDNEKRVLLVCLFQKKWEKRLGIMKKGDDIRYKGVISTLNIRDRIAELIDCEIVE